MGSGTSTVVTEALGQSEPFLEFQERLSRVAPINRQVLLIGERGTGKELAAARLHYLSNRWQAPMVALNCAALSPSLIESELFGYEKGAFTGALQRRFGRFESADRGTLFLDEIGSIPLEVQEKILRVVEYNVFERVGSSESIEVDVRIIAATNADLNDLTRKNRFKQDLLDRLSFEVLFLPPLRERKEDITLLAGHFAGRMAMELEWDEIPVFSDEAVEALEKHLWPGNIRELKNVIESASVIAENGFIEPAQLPAKITGVFNNSDNNRVSLPAANLPLDERLKEIEKSMIIEALRKTGGVQVRATELLGINQRSLWHRIKKYGIDVKGIKNNDI